MFSRIVQDKLICKVELRITSIVLNVQQPLILKINWKRGPQTDSSQSFEVNKHANTYELNLQFERESHFYRDKHGAIQRKECEILLMFTSMGKDEQTGSVQIDLAPFFDQGEVFHSFKLSNETVTKNAQINAFFTVTDQVKTRSEDAKGRAKTRSPQNRKAASTIMAVPINQRTLTAFDSSSPA